MDATDSRAKIINHVDLDAGAQAAGAQDERLQKLQEDKEAKRDEPRPINFGQLLTADQHKAHVAAHYENCKAQIALGSSVGASKELEQALTGHGYKLSEVAATDVTGDGRVLKTTLLVEDAKEWERPWDLAAAKVHYTLWLEPSGGARAAQQLHSTKPDGGAGGAAAEPVEILIDEPPVVAATADGAAAAVTDGPGPWLPGLEAALKTMRRGETARISIRPNAPPPSDEAAKRSRARPSDTTQHAATVGFPEGHPHHGAAVVAEVTLVGFENPGSVMMMGSEEELARAAECKTFGNARFKIGDYVRALRRYKRALELLECLLQSTSVHKPPLKFRGLLVVFVCFWPFLQLLWVQKLSVFPGITRVLARVSVKTPP